MSQEYSAKSEGPIGVLLTNLGTPDAPTSSAVRRYLKQFLSDPRVVEIPKFIWWFILRFLILPFRPKKSAKLYRSIWTEQGSPLLTTLQQQTQHLQLRFADEDIVIVPAMRYGNPSISAGIHQLRQHNAKRILVFPLYPQYSAATTASTFDAVFDEIKPWRYMPELRTVCDYHDNPLYIDALAKSIEQHWQQQGRGQLLLMSFHGIPERNVKLGDPYHQQCLTTAKLLAQALQLQDDQWMCCFQSRFGPAKWLQPYTDKTLEQLPAKGIKQVDVICPGFSADCLETLEEINETNRELFLEAGGERYQYIPALNDREQHLLLLENIIQRYTDDWGQAQ